MELILKKQGNSTGLNFPAAFLRERHLSAGQVIIVEDAPDGTLVLRPKAVRPHYTAAELNAQCDFNAPWPDDVLAWQAAPAVGLEQI